MEKFLLVPELQYKVNLITWVYCNQRSDQLRSSISQLLLLGAPLAVISMCFKCY
jgi:hypothetical protein